MSSSVNHRTETTVGESASSPHVAIDMTVRPPTSSADNLWSSANRSNEQQPPAAHIAPPIVVTTTERSRSRSRSRSTGSSRSPAHNNAIADATTTASKHRSTRNLQLSATDAEPLLPNNDPDVEMIPRRRPPLVHPENEDDDNEDERRHQPRLPNTPDAHPGVDPGFFPTTDSADRPDYDSNGNDLDGDNVDGPKIASRSGGDNGSGHHPTSRRPSFPQSGFDGVEGGIYTPDVNVYQQKKTLAQGMMDLALLSANANQLRYVIESSSRHPYFLASLIFISISIILQVAVGVGLIWNSRYNVKNNEHIHKADRINNYTVIGIFLITTVNVFVTSFGVSTTDTLMPAP